VALDVPVSAATQQESTDAMGGDEPIGAGTPRPAWANPRHQRQRSSATAELRVCLVGRDSFASRQWPLSRSQWLNVARLGALLSLGDRVAHPLSLIEALVA
jgi:hypothetical protein